MTQERIARMEVQIEHLKETVDKHEELLAEIGHVARRTSTQLLVGVGVIVTVLNILSNVLSKYF